ncbi:MAG TPA: hypothetical protein DD417_00565 [Elusimicrobia bacterium]|nr:hypothetical protein [Elusimicrobiota bacterium]
MRRLLVVNLMLAAVAVVFGVMLARELSTLRALPDPPPREPRRPPPRRPAPAAKRCRRRGPTSGRSTT